MDRDERLRAAKEKLKKFQKKRKNPSPVSLDEISNTSNSNSEIAKAFNLQGHLGSHPSGSGPGSHCGYFNNGEDSVAPAPQPKDVTLDVACVPENESTESVALFTMFSDKAPKDFQDQVPELQVSANAFNATTESMPNSCDTLIRPSEVCGEDDLRTSYHSDPEVQGDSQKQKVRSVLEYFPEMEKKKMENENVIGVVSFGVDGMMKVNDNRLEHQLQGSECSTKTLSEQIDKVLSTSRHFDSGDQSGLSGTISQYRAQIEQMKKEKTEMSVVNQQQASSILHFEAYCKSLTKKLEAAEEALERERADFGVKLGLECCSLKDQLKSHAESIKILVGEKADFDASMNKAEKEIRDQADEISQLREKCKQQDPVELARTSVEKSVIDSLRNECETYKRSSEDLEEEAAEMRSKLSYKEQEIKALNNQLSDAASKYELAELNLNQLRAVMSKEGDGSCSRELTEAKEEAVRLENENKEHLRRVEELTTYIQQATIDREQIIHQYTSYSQQLTTQIEVLTRTLNEKVTENQELTVRETDLVSHVQRLEQQLQKLIQKGSLNDESDDLRDEERVSRLKEELTNSSTRVRELETALEEIKLSNESLEKHHETQESKMKELRDELLECRGRISSLQTELEMERIQSGSDVMQEDLIAACQSDKVAASRAMLQNRKMKDQVEELELAIIQVTNSKAQLASELETLKRKESKWNETEASMQLELKGLRDAVNERDRCIQQLREQVKYYIAFAENSIRGHPDVAEPCSKEDPFATKQIQPEIEKIVRELKDAKEEIRCLNSHNSELRSQLEVLSQRTRDSSGTPRPNSGATPITLPDDMSSSSSPTSSSLTISSSPRGGSPESSDTSSQEYDVNSLVGDGDHSKQQTELNCFQNVPSDVNSGLKFVDGRHASTPFENKKAAVELNSRPSLASMDNGIPPLSSEVALLKLEHKFRNAMLKIADLTSEKERLEHLVVQLQEETNTVGEYITIYHYQRKQQKHRMAEKETQLQIMSRDREEMKIKLSQLQDLVKHFVQKRMPNVQASSRTHSPHGSNDNTIKGTAVPLEVATEALEIRGDQLEIGAEVKQVLSKVDASEGSPSELKMIEAHNVKEESSNEMNMQLDKTVSSSGVDITTEKEANTSTQHLGGVTSDGNVIGVAALKGAASNGSTTPEIRRPMCADPITNDNPGDVDGDEKFQTAAKILALITEIESNQMLSQDKNFHPWFWEPSQGPLMTV